MQSEGRRPGDTCRVMEVNLVPQPLTDPLDVFQSEGPRVVPLTGVDARSSRERDSYATLFIRTSDVAPLDENAWGHDPGFNTVELQRRLLAANRELASDLTSQARELRAATRLLKVIACGIVGLGVLQVALRVWLQV